MFRWLMWVKDPRNSLWISPTIGAIFAVSFAIIASLSDRIGFTSVPDIQESVLKSLLNVLASSMLAVTTFSLSIMVSAFASTANNITPRATTLVMNDDSTRVAIASFISSFVYAIIVLVALSIDLYQKLGRFVLFIATTLVFLYLIIMIIRWVGTLAKLGRLDNTLEKLETATTKCVKNYMHNPLLGAKQANDIPEGKLIKADKSGYLAHIDMSYLSEIANDTDCQLYLWHRPGDFISIGEKVITVVGETNDFKSLETKAMNALIIANERSYDQDPRHGLTVLSEIAQRALSPSINDPNTAIRVMSVITKIINDSARAKTLSTEASDLLYDNLYVRPLDQAAFVVDSFDAITLDGCDNIFVATNIQIFLAKIYQFCDDHTIASAALKQAKRSLERSEQVIKDEQDIASLKQMHETSFEDGIVNKTIAEHLHSFQE